MIGISIANSIGFTGTSVLPDPAASSYFAATGITGITQQAAIDSLVKGLKSDGLWSKMKAVYPFVTDNRNLFSYTEDFSDAYWTKAALAITTNATTAPNGTLTADKAIPAASTGAHDLSKLLTRTSGSYTATISIYAKQSEDRYFCLSLQDSIGGLGITFDISTGVVSTATSTYGTGWSEVSNSITAVGSGWYRLTYTATTTNATTQLTGLYRPGNIPNLFGGSTGNGVNGVFVWGAQLESGSTATTYQPIATTQQSYISNQFKYNLKDPRDLDAAYRLVFNGGWTLSSTGALPNGTNAYADTKLNQTAAGMYANSHFSYYSRTDNVSATQQIDMGAGNNVFGTFSNVVMWLDNTTNYVGCSAGTRTPVSTTTNSLGHLTLSANVASAKSFKNGLLIATDSTVQAGILNTYNIYLGCHNNGGNASQFSSRQTAFATIGDGLTDTEATNLYTRIQAYQTALSRQV